MMSRKLSILFGTLFALMLFAGSSRAAEVQPAPAMSAASVATPAAMPAAAMAPAPVPAMAAPAMPAVAMAPVLVPVPAMPVVVSSPMAALAPAPAAPPAASTEPTTAPASTEPVSSEPPVVVTAAATPTPVPAMEPAAPATAVAVATPAASTNNWWQTSLGGLIQILLLLLGGIAAPIGVLLVRYLMKKAKIEDATEKHVLENLAIRAVDTGIYYATQLANKLNNTPDARSQRIKWATEKAGAVLREYGIVDKTDRWIMDRIESQLGMVNGTKPSEEEAKAAEDTSTKPE